MSTPPESVEESCGWGVACQHGPGDAGCKRQVGATSGDALTDEEREALAEDARRLRAVSAELVRRDLTNVAGIADRVAKRLDALAARAAQPSMPAPMAVERHDYLGWKDGQVYCECGRRFDSMQRYDAHARAAQLSVPAPPTAAEDGPECDLCGRTDCPDADLAEFSEPVACALTPAYKALRYDRCEYGCGRDVTKASIREAVRALAQDREPHGG